MSETDNFEQVQNNEELVNSEVNEVEEEDFSDSDSDEVETIDVTNEPMYHILSAFFEDEDGLNIVDRLSDLVKAVNNNTKTLNKVLKSLAKKE
jgi:predicted  nucleic acid-binding Zn-ribbon protein